MPDGIRAELDASLARLASAPSEGNWREEVTIVVKTFERLKCLANLLVSIRRYYPTLPVLVCDDSWEPLYGDGSEPFPGIFWVTLPYERGHTLGAGRNFLLRQVKTPLFFLCDDDHEFTSKTRLDWFHAMLQLTGVDILGGCQGRDDLGTAVFEGDRGVVRQVFYRFHKRLAPAVAGCDRVSNTFLGRVEPVRALGWEERVYGSEHAEFFFRAKREGLRVAQLGHVYVNHARHLEEARGWLSRLAGRWMPHRDRDYLRKRNGEEGSPHLPGASRAELVRRFCYEKNGIEGIRDEKDFRAKRELIRILKEPLPETVCPSGGGAGSANG